MPDQDQIQEIDFDSQLRGLFEEAEKQIEDRHAPAARSRGVRRCGVIAANFLP